jgi:endonuclease/exonuclease/phosphatase family metal-dependent hydrolase
MAAPQRVMEFHLERRAKTRQRAAAALRQTSAVCVIAATDRRDPAQLPELAGQNPFETRIG